MITYLNCRNKSFVIKIFINIGAIRSCFIGATPNCGYLQFPCHDGQCINLRDVCDGINNCSDGSDEDYCNSTGWFFLDVFFKYAYDCLFLTRKQGSNLFLSHTWQQCYVWLTSPLQIFTTCMNIH